MPDFQPHTLDSVACQQQVQELKALLDSSADILLAIREQLRSELQRDQLVNRAEPALIKFAVSVIREVAAIPQICRPTPHGETGHQIEMSGPENRWNPQGAAADE